MSQLLKEKIMQAFLEKSILTGGELEKKLGVTRSAISKVINSLIQDGLNIETIPRKGYKFLDDNDILSKATIDFNIDAKKYGKQIEILDSVDSTNLYLKNLIDANEGYTVIADKQIGGMGRKGRKFISEKGGIYFSILLKPKIEVSDIKFLTFCAALSVAESIKSICGIDVGIKWVNDIFYDSKKLCGISTDATLCLESMTLKSAIIGIGINLHPLSDNDFSDTTQIQNIATDIFSITRQTGFRNKLIAKILSSLEFFIDKLVAGKKLEILSLYKDNICVMGSVVKVIPVNNAEYLARVIGLNDNGELKVNKLTDDKSLSNEIQFLSTEEVSIMVMQDE